MMTVLPPRGHERTAGRAGVRGPFLLVLLLLLLSSLAAGRPVLGASSWSVTGSMSVGRSHAAAVRLQDGRVLVVGGETGTGSLQTPTASAEVYDPNTGIWYAVAPMETARADFTATLLNDGRVLVAGGTDGPSCQASAELFDPGTGAWSSAGSMSEGRCSATATLLTDGRVLVAGGFGLGGALASADLYNPETGSWSPTEAMSVARGDHTATLRKDGEVLVAGGFGSSGPLNSVELYDPASGHWVGFRPLPTLLHARYSHTATLLPDGKILVAGGFDTSGPLSSAELYDPATNDWTATAPMAVPRGLQTATLLPGGQVLVAGGQTEPEQGSLFTPTAELYDPAGATWSSAGRMAIGRAAQSATVLGDGDVLIAGGSSGSQDLAESELYHSPQVEGSPSPTAVATSAATPSPTSTSTIPPPPPPPTGPPVASATPPSTSSFSIRSVRVEKYGSPPDWGLTRSPLAHVKAGTRVWLSIYVTFAAVGNPSQVSVAVTARRGSHTAFHGSLREERRDTGTLVYRWVFEPHTAGTYTVSGQVTVDGRTARMSTHLRVLARAVSFTFDRLVTLDSHGHIAHRFGRNQWVVVQATFTVRDASGSVKVTVGQSLEYRSGSTWIALGRRVRNSFETTNGRHAYSVSFYPQSPYSVLRMVLRIRIGHHTETRATSFEVLG